MALPNNEIDIEKLINGELVFEDYPTETYKINFETNRVERMTDGLEAMKQAFYLAINTERFIHPAFTNNYGMEWDNLIGRPEDYIISETLYRIKDMVEADKRFLSVDYWPDKNFEIKEDYIIIYLTVSTTYGDFLTSVNVNY